MTLVAIDEDGVDIGSPAAGPLTLPSGAYGVDVAGTAGTRPELRVVG